MVSESSEASDCLSAGNGVDPALAGLLMSGLDAMPDAFCCFDAQDRVVVCNAACRSIYAGIADLLVPGVAFEAIVDAGLQRGLFPTEGLDSAEWRRLALERRPGSGSVQSVLRLGDGRLVSRNDFAAPGGGWISITTDITEQKRRRREAAEIRTQLVNVLESMPAGIVIYDRNDNYVLANRAVHESLPALVPYMIPGRPLREILAVAHAAGYFSHCGDPAVDALFATDREAWIEAQIRRYHVPEFAAERRNSDGSWFKTFDRRCEDGTFIGVRLDITDMKQHEAELSAAMRDNELFRSLIDNVPVSIYAKRPDLRLAYVNKGWCDLTGLPRDKVLGRTDIEIFGEEGRPYFESDRAVLATGKDHVTEEVADGGRRHQLSRKSVMKATDGSLYLIGSTSDITELKERERDLREANRKAVLADRAKSEFLANMSHEIRTPMNGVLGMAELLAKSDLSPRQKTFTDIIMKSGNALLTIINDILDFSKIDAGQLVLDPAPFCLAEAIEDVATLISSRAREKDLELIVRIQPNLPQRFVGDAGRIRQIVTNLVGNSVKFTDAGHILVNIAGSPAGGGTQLTIGVTDTGIGIPPDKLKLVFEKFSQVDGSSTRRHEGTGLGLAISASLVELMGGTIAVESELGQGSTFTVSIALPNAEAAEKPAGAPLDVTGARILIVDDNPVNRAILTEQAASWRFDACAAESGTEGLAVLRAAARLGVAVDCVILDYQMPGMTGADMARAMSEDTALAGVPVVLLTSVDQSLSTGRYRDLGVEAHMLKPARASVLLQTVIAAIQKGRERRAGAEIARSAAPPPAAAEPGRRVRTPGSGVHRVDILVAEDNDVNQLVFAQILDETGLAYQIVGNGELALEAAAEMNPRMILMDVSMPRMGGLEATRRIREIEASSGAHVPIVGVTAHALKGDRERCLEAGMDDYIPKPISPRALLEKVRRWISQDHADQAEAG